MALFRNVNSIPFTRQRKTNKVKNKIAFLLNVVTGVFWCSMKLTRERIVGFIVLGLGMALLLFVAWPQSLNIVRSIYHSDNLGKY